MREDPECVLNDAKEISLAFCFRSFFSLVSSAILEFRTRGGNCASRSMDVGQPWLTRKPGCQPGGETSQAGWQPDFYFSASGLIFSIG
jgi:hypothetical protein